MKTYNDLYTQLCAMGNITIAWRKAREGKTLRLDVMKFEENLELNLLILHNELRTKTYKPKPLTTFVLRDPKTRVISKSDFRDRIVHHAIVNIIQPIFEKQFIYDSCANQVKKGTLFALERFSKYVRKVSHPTHQGGFCLKADIKQYFQGIDHEVLLHILKRRIADADVLWLIQQVLFNVSRERERESRCAVCLWAT